MDNNTSAPTSYEWLEHQEYISLVTFKKSGQRVPSPVWFATAGGKLYVYSELQAGKMKRIRNNATVEIAPCTMRGQTTGPTVTGHAVELPAEKGQYVHDLLNRKYGWKKRVFEAGAKVPVLLRLRKANPEGFIEISLD